MEARESQISFCFGGGINYRQVALSQISQLMSKLELLGSGAFGEFFFQISPNILRRSCIPNVAQELFTHTGGEAVENSTRRLFPGQEVFVYRFGCCIICSIDITLVSMPEQILVHLV